MIGCDNVQGTTRVLRRVLFRDNIVFHAVEIEDGGAATFKVKPRTLQTTLPPRVCYP